MSNAGVDTSTWTTNDWLMQRYKYIPSLPAAALFAALFGISTLLHIYHTLRWRTWYWIPFVVGGMFETVGYVLRTIDINVASLNLYIAQIALILLAPALFAASIYMTLRRLIMALEAERYSLISVRWLTRFFVGSDIVSFITQGAGGSMQATTNADSPGRAQVGQWLVVAGLILQLVVFGFFIAVTATFHVRIHRRPTGKSARLARAGTAVPWLRFIYVLYLACALIMIRSIFRVVEYAEGRDGYLMSQEVFAYIFDAMLMFGVTVVFNLLHPNKVVSNRMRREHVPLKQLGAGRKAHEGRRHDSSGV
jgi:hypothetical protein